jgi:hypothetical protein
MTKPRQAGVWLWRGAHRVRGAEVLQAQTKPSAALERARFHDPRDVGRIIMRPNA